MPGLKKAELVDGIVYMPSPVKTNHSKPHGKLSGWLDRYEESTPGCEFLPDTTLRLDMENDLQPDGLLRLLDAAGGRSRVSHDDYIEGPVELCAEVASSSASYDLNQKKRVNQRCGIQEYFVWVVRRNEVCWWKLEGGEYVDLAADQDGVIKSEVFPGLWLDAAALQREDWKEVYAKLREGLSSPEHAKFVAELENRMNQA